MHSHFHDTYCHLDSPLHRLEASVKLLAALALIAGLVAIRPSPVLFTVAGFVLVLLAAASNIPAFFLVKRLIMLEPFIIGAALLVLLEPDGGIRFAAIVTRSSLCLLTMVLLTNTTPFSELLIVLRKLRVPAILVTTLALMHRYLYVFKDQLSTLRNARQSRTFTTRRQLEWRSLASVIGVLFVRSGERAQRVYCAMCARGWR